MPVTHFDRYATITIQGGGIYGLNLLGQLAWLVDDLEIIPLGLAGNSAGAIIATLYWAGLSPESIKEKLKEACTVDPGQTHRRLIGWLGPFDAFGGESYDYDRFVELTDRLYACLSAFDSRSIDKIKSHNDNWIKRLVWRAGEFCWSLATLIRIYRASEGLLPHLGNNGIFRGDLFEKTIDEWIRESPRVRSRSSSLPPPSGEVGGRLLTFGDLSKLDDIFFLPLFLTATNLTHRRLEVISSFEPAYAHWPIARAVRASAGFPVFFRPVPVEGRPVGSWYVRRRAHLEFPVVGLSREDSKKFKRIGI